MILLVSGRVISCNGLSLSESVKLVVNNLLLCKYVLHSCAIGRSISVKDKSYVGFLCYLSS